MKRRHFLAGTAALGGAIGPSIITSSVAQQGPIFLDYTQEQLDQAYDQAVWAPQINELQAYDDTSSAAVRKAMPPRTERYGKSDVELVDIFAPPDARGLPVMGRLASRTVAFAANHFQEPQRLAKPDSELSRVLFSLMKI